MVLVSKENKRKIFEYLLKEGVIVVKKDSYLPKHQHITDVPNLHVMMIVKSLKSQDYLQDVFAWQWSYYFITNKGVAFLVKELGLPADIVPATFKKRRATTAINVKGEAGDEKPEKNAGDEETARATGLGRGQR